MHRPDVEDERVVALYHDEKRDEIYYTRGLYTGDNDGGDRPAEHFVLKLLTKDGNWVKQRVHKEEIYKSTKDNLERVPIEILKQV